MHLTEPKNILIEQGIKPTPNRVLIYRELSKASRPLSLAHLETALAPMDKASVFRVLELFTSKGLVHVIDDGSRSLKYELCHSHDHSVADDQHPHFYCEKCKQTFCLEDSAIPEIKIPAGYQIHSANFVLKGICPDCGIRNP